MALADGFKDIAERRKKTLSCAYQTMYESLSATDQKALDEAWAKGFSRNEVLMVLRAEGIKSSNESIRKHKIGTCPCPK